MGDSDDEVYFGRVTVQELEVVSKRFLSGSNYNAPSSLSDHVLEENVTISTLESSNDDSLKNSGVAVTECFQSTLEILEASSNDDAKFSGLKSCCLITHSDKQNFSKNSNEDSNIISRSPLAEPLVLINDGTQQENDAILEMVTSECEITNNEVRFVDLAGGSTASDSFDNFSSSQKISESVKLSDTVVPEITIHECQSFTSAFTKTLSDVTASNCDSTEAHLSSIHKSFDTSGSYALKSDASMCSNSQTLSSGCISADSKVSTPKASVSFSHGLAPNVFTQSLLVSTDSCTSSIINQSIFESHMKCPAREISVDSTDCTSQRSGDKIFNDIALRLKNLNIISDGGKVEISQLENVTASIPLSDTAKCKDFSKPGASDKPSTKNNHCISDPVSDVGNSNQRLTQSSRDSVDVLSILDICVQSNNSVTNDFNALLGRDDSQLGGCTLKKKVHQFSSDDDIFSTGGMLGYGEIDDENDSVLCSTLSNSSIDEDKECNLNNTLEEMELMLKYGEQYMLSTDDSVLSEGSQNKLQQDCPRQPVSEKLPRRRILEPSQYVRAAHAEATSSVFQREIKEYNHTGALFKTPTTRTFALKTGSSYSHRPLQRIKKRMHFSDIRSPVAAYIKDRPVQLLKTAVKVKSHDKDDVLPRHCVQETVVPSNKQAGVHSTPALPEIRYERAPVFNVKRQPQSNDRCIRSKKNYTTPTVIRHAGRAVLATVPHNAVQLSNSEVSVVFDKDVSRTTTL